MTDYFFEKIQNKTILIIAYRINTILNFDKILVMTHCEIKEFDTKIKLLKNSYSLFSILYDKMNSNFNQ